MRSDAAICLKIAIIISLFLSFSGSALAEGGQPPAIKIMTLNLHNGKDSNNERNFARFAQLIAVEQPDIIALQEVQRRHLKYLRIPGYNWVSGPNANLPFFRFGNALLTRHPIVYHRHHYLPSQKEQRGMDEVAIDIDNQTIRILNTHIGLGLSEQKQQINEIARISGYLPGPLLIAGDFNLEPSHKAMAVLNLREVGDGLPGYKTFPAQEPRLQLDQIWYNEHFQRVDAKTMDWLGSDHLPLLATMILKSSGTFPMKPEIIPDPTLRQNPLLPDVGVHSAKAELTTESDDSSYTFAFGIEIPIKSRFLINIGSNGDDSQLAVTYLKSIDMRDYGSLSGMRGKAEWGLSFASDMNGENWWEWSQYYRWSDIWGTRIVLTTKDSRPNWRWEQSYLPTQRLRLTAGVNADSEFSAGVAVTPDTRQVLQAQYVNGQDGTEYSMGWEIRF